MRGQDNFRVRIQENGIATSDVSDIGEDHPVTIDPLASKQIEVIRGPATLRWGSQAIGGVVEVDNNRIPTWIPPGGVAHRSEGRPDHGQQRSRRRCCSTPARAISPSTPMPSAGAATTTASPAIPICFLPTRRRSSTAGSRTRRSAPRAPPVGGSYLFDGGFAGVAVSQFRQHYRIPGIEATETGTRIDASRPRSPARASSGRNSARSTRSASGSAPPTTSTTSSPSRERLRRRRSRLHQQVASEGRVEVQLMPFDLAASPRSPPRRRAVEPQPARCSGRGAALSRPHPDRRRLFLQRAAATRRCGRKSPAASSRPTSRARGVPAESPAADPTLRSASPATSNSRPRASPRLPQGPAVGHGREPDRAMCRARAESAGAVLQGPARGHRDLRHRQRRPHIETAKSVETGLKRAVGPFRFEATAYYTRFDDFIFQAADRPFLRARNSPPAAAAAT